MRKVTTKVVQEGWTVIKGVAVAVLTDFIKRNV
jgi:hypothetical protein